MPPNNVIHIGSSVNGWIAVAVTLAIEISAAVWWAGGLSTRMRDLERHTSTVNGSTATIAAIGFRLNKIDETVAALHPLDTRLARIEERMTMIDQRTNLIAAALAQMAKPPQPSLPPKPGDWQP